MQNFKLFGMACVLVIAPCGAHAGGFMLRDQSVSSMGHAFAGRASAADDVSTLYGNPAGIVLSDRAALSVLASRVTANIDISNATGTFPGSNQGDMLESAVIPAVYAVLPLTSGWVAGIGVYGSFGLSTKYESGFQGRYFGAKSELSDMTVQPTLAWQIDDHWSIAADITWNRARGELGMAAPNPLSPGTDDIAVSIEGEDTAWGYGFGVLYRLGEATKIGAAYHSAVKFTLDGHTTIANVPFQGTLRYRGSLDLETPDLFELSLTQRLSSDWILQATVSQAGWHSFDEIRVENEGGPGLVEPQGWHDARFYALGLSYQFKPDWLLRIGYGFDDTPQPNSTRNVRLNDNDRNFYAIGATWGNAAGQGLSIDFAYMLISQEAAKVQQSASGVYGYSATYHTDIQDAAIQLNYRF